MRLYEETIEVRTAQDAAAGPQQFLWRGRLWLVRDILGRWVEAGAWWNSARSRSARGEDPALIAVAEEPEADLLVEDEVWRVLAGAGRSSEPGVYELARRSGTDTWRLRAVVD